MMQPIRQSVDETADTLYIYTLYWVFSTQMHILRGPMADYNTDFTLLQLPYVDRAVSWSIALSD